MPWLFEVRNLCSFTPEMLFGLSMAESLMGIGALLSLVAAVTITMDLIRPHQSAFD
jgi:disulfide bond formation protein DsbB